MPVLDQTFRIDVTPEKFLNACSQEELIELDLLMSSPRIVEKMKVTSSDELLKNNFLLEEKTPVDINNRKCRECGCTQNDCSQCIDKTGNPCFWIEPDLCSACRKANE